jgi:catechol 2,3-dioxygenase-like lactoylglutathione lyase family enzyme
MSANATSAVTGPALRLNFLSHGTLESTNLEASRRFYEDFLGFEVVRTSPISLLLRLGGKQAIVVVEVGDKKPMTMLNHYGLDVSTREEVDRAHGVIVGQKDRWGIGKVTRPAEQHGTYSFFFWDADENCWEILTNPKDGYTWAFERGEQTGRGHLDKSFRPGPSD